MKKLLLDLQRFTDGAGDGAGAGSGVAGGNGNQNAGGNSNNNGGQPSAGYSYQQADEIATARADRATKSALSSYFQQQGMTQQEAEAAIAKYKADKAASTPDVSKLQSQLDEANKKLADQANQSYLTSKNVKADDLDYVLFKVNQKVDDKTDFKKAADTFLKENPRYIGQQTYRMSTSVQGGGNGNTQTPNETINAAIRSHFGR